MKSYAGSDLRNVAVVGHAHSGKTTLISAILKVHDQPLGVPDRRTAGQRRGDRLVRDDH